MDVTCPDSADSTTRTREHLSNLYSLFVVSMMMFDGRTEDDILELARASVPSVSTGRVAAAYLAHEGGLVRLDAQASQLDAQVEGLGGLDGEVAVDGVPWARAFVLRDFTGPHGYLVVSADAEPSPNEMFLVKVLVQQTASALANASLHKAEREHSAQLRSLNEERAAVNERLAATVADLRRQRDIHEVLTGTAAAGAGEAGIAKSLHELTDLPVTIEDQFGNVRTWVGPGLPDSPPKPSPHTREQLLNRAARTAGRSATATGWPWSCGLGMTCSACWR